MLNLTDLFTQTTTNEIISLGMFEVSLIASLFLGLLLSFSIQYKSFISKSFAVTITLLPAVVSVVIMMVNGSIGTGIAVAGTFSLVRFRSIPGSAREIVAVFIAMAIGLACGMGNVLYASTFTLTVVVVLLILENSSFGELGSSKNMKVLRVTIPEDLDYTDIFEDVFNDFTSSHQLIKARTTNLGSMFKLTYHIKLINGFEEKDLIDQIRLRNGNLEVSCSQISATSNEL